MFLVAALVIACRAPGAGAFGEAPRFLIASSPSTATVAYVKLPSTGGPGNGKDVMRILINTGLTYPQGLAVDEYRQMLYVADPSMGKLVRFPLRSSEDALTVGAMETVATNVEVRAVAVDGVGNVWFTDESQQRVMRVTAKMIESGMKTPQIVYSASENEEVRSPGGIALDSFFVYWLNKAEGQTAGSIIKGTQNPDTTIISAAPTVTNGTSNATSALLATSRRTSVSLTGLGYNAEKCYGVCLSQRNAFYTDEFKNIYGVPRTATARNEVVTISTAFQEPRGCAYDGDSTVYVTDKAQNAIFSFAANMEQLLPGRSMTKAAELQGAFGVAVYTNLDL